MLPNHLKCNNYCEHTEKLFMLTHENSGNEVSNFIKTNSGMILFLFK